MNTFDKVLETRRTIRRFCDRPIAREDMEQLLNLARLAPSGANLQPLRYIAVLSREKCEEVFRETAWAGYVLSLIHIYIFRSFLWMWQWNSCLQAVSPICFLLHLPQLLFWVLC